MIRPGAGLWPTLALAIALGLGLAWLMRHGNVDPMAQAIRAAIERLWT